MSLRHPSRIWNDDHTSNVYVSTSQNGRLIIVGTDDNAEDVWLTPEGARKLARDLISRAKLAETLTPAP